MRNAQALRSRRSRAGLSLIEALISLAIVASLLAAVGAAYAAAADAIRVNDEFFRASQAARVAVNQILAEVRRCQSGVVADTSLELTTDLGVKRTYFLDENSRLKMTIDGIIPVTYSLVSNISSIKFDTDGETISMTVTVHVGNNEVVLNGSAIPRRTVEYK
jgi:type II secretory pathway pseudopilin PulG